MMGGAAVTLALTCAAVPAMAAEGYPTRPITLVVPSGAGGGYDVTARTVTQAMSKILGQPFVVENRVGAAGTLGAAHAAKARPDGYTLFWGGNGPLTLSPYIYANVGYDPQTSFRPVSIGSTSAYGLVVSGDSAFDSVQDLIDFGRKHPGKLTYASNGQNGGLHLLGETLSAEGGFEALHIPYKGGTEGVTAVISKNVDFTFDAISTAIPFVDGKRMKVLAITGSNRNTVYPDTPTFAELGMPALTSDIFFGLLAPANTPDAIVARLAAAMDAALQEDEVREVILATGNVPHSSSPEAFSELISKEASRWRSVLQEKGITPQ